MSALLLLGALLAVTPAELEQGGAQHVVREYERIGRTAPLPDPTLGEAARKLAALALETSAEEAADALSITGMVSDAGGHDPTPRAVVIRASPPELALATFLKRRDLNEEPASFMGVGVVVRGDRAALAVLLSERKATLAPFPRALLSPGSRILCGELLPPLQHAELYVTRPSGQVEKVALTRDQGGPFCAAPTFGAGGRHSLEVLGHGPRGPEVAAIFSVDVGATRPDSARARVVEPTDVEGARAAVLARMNALRQAQGASALSLDDALSQVAQSYSQRMAGESFFAHVAPDGSDLRGRLTRAGYRYERAGENLGLASGPLAAHFALEHSPGHRKNLLDGDFTRVGIGVAFSRQGDRAQVLLTEVFTRPVVARADSIEDAYRALAARRTALHLPPLERSEALEQIANAHVRKALSLDLPKAQLPGSTVHDRVFSALPGVKSASVDFVVADSLTGFPDSKGLADSRNDQVGIGTVKGDSPTYGKRRFWVVVIYAASR